MKKAMIFKISAYAIAAVILVIFAYVGSNTNWFSLGEAEEANEFEGNKRYVNLISSDELDTINISWMNGSVEVVFCAGDTIAVTEITDRSLDEGEKLEYNCYSGVLSVEWNSGIYFIGAIEPLEKKLIIELPYKFMGDIEYISCSGADSDISISNLNPQTAELYSVSGDLSFSKADTDNVSLETVSGNIFMEDVSSGESAVIKTLSGEMTFSECDFNKTDMKTSSGNIGFSGKLRECLVSSISGNVNINTGYCPEKADFESVSGEYSLTLPENDGFAVSFSSLSGNLASEFPLNPSGRAEDDFVYGNGSRKMTFKSTSADMTVLNEKNTV